MIHESLEGYKRERSSCNRTHYYINPRQKGVTDFETVPSLVQKDQVKSRGRKVYKDGVSFTSSL